MPLNDRALTRPTLDAQPPRAFAVQARYGSTAINERARAVYKDSFRAGHSCRLCPAIVIPEGLSGAEIDRRAVALRRAHFTRLALASSRKRKKTATAVEKPGVVTSEVRLDSGAGRRRYHCRTLDHQRADPRPGGARQRTAPQWCAAGRCPGRHRYLGRCRRRPGAGDGPRDRGGLRGRRGTHQALRVSDAARAVRIGCARHRQRGDGSIRRTGGRSAEARARERARGARRGGAPALVGGAAIAFDDRAAARVGACGRRRLRVAGGGAGAALRRTGGGGGPIELNVDRDR